MNNTLNQARIPKRIALIGAGISNLTFINLLKKTKNLNLKVTLFERSEVIGGRVATRHRNDLFFDNGANYFDFTDKRIENLILNELNSEMLFKVQKPIFFFDANNNIITDQNLNSKPAYQNLFNYFNNTNKPNYTYTTGLRTLPNLLLQNPQVKFSEDFECEIKFSKNIFSIEPSFVSNDNSNSVTRSNLKWTLFTKEQENLGEYDKIIFGTPSLNIARILEQSALTLLDDKEKEFFIQAKKELSICTYKTIYSMAIAYDLNEFPNMKQFNDFFGLVNVDNKHFISTVFVENEKNRKDIAEKNWIFFVVQFGENQKLKNLEFEKDKKAFSQLARENLENLLPILKNKSVKYEDLKRWSFSFPNKKIEKKLLNEFSKRNLEVLGDSVCGIGKIDKAMLTAFDLYETNYKF